MSLRKRRSSTNGIDAQPDPATGLTHRIALWSATHRGKAVGLWLLLIVLATGLAAIQGPRQATEQELSVGESAHAMKLADDAGYVDPVVENVLITAPGKAGEAQTAAAQVRSSLRTLAAVADVSPPLRGKGGDALLVRVTMKGDPDTAQDRVGPLERVVDGVQAAHPGIRVEEVGPASIGSDFQQWLDKDLGKATTLSLPITLAILLIVFGAIVMAGIPLVLAISSVAAGLGLWTLASQVVPDPGTTMHLLVLVGMAVGVDYSLFYLRRYREERHAGRDNVSAVHVAAATAGHSVVVSGLAVALSMAGLFIAGDAFSSAMATGAIIVVLVALVSSVTVLPAMLSAFGRFVDRPRLPVLWRLSNGTNGDRPRLMAAIVRPVLRHPKAALLLCIAVLGALALPMTQMSLKSTQIEDYPRTLTTMQSYDRLLAAFPDRSGVDTVVVRVPAGSEPAVQQQVAALRTQAAQRPDLFGAVDQPWRSRDARTYVLDVNVPHPVTSSESRTAVTTLREQLVPRTLGSVPGADVAVGGDAAANMDYTQRLDTRLPFVLAAVLAVVLVVMLAAYRSVAVAVMTVALNGLSVLAAFGVLTLVFQGTWAEGLLGFTSTGHVVSWVPMLLFVVLSGLSLDYHVFVVSRIRENTVLGMDTRAAIEDGIVRTAGVVTSAAVVMIAVFSIFGALSFVELKQIGVGLAVGILIDATLIRVIALPALMLLCRRFLWWPARPARTVQSARSRRAADELVETV
ncbi:MMPL family transporter [Luteipulveratus flavus]|uniref:MMPL family transporter n=1 Tax=Luteipulveratus flavus TaxID=3031728 RepID=A0ABT6C6V3_9MICO|nr:MMPL family transporter [Luteipulveratus sp. YIM 133296]MDF8264578.1 MMPL family transporter [Luteipulveratus sp. YIM 133296]